MNSACTPKPVMSHVQSSVFLTPPFSTEKHQYEETQIQFEHQQQVTEFLNLRLTPERKQDEEDSKVDIISQLAQHYPLVATSVLTLLNPADLVSCLQINKSWRNAVRSHYPSLQRIRLYRIQKQLNQENLHQQSSTFSSIVTPSTPRLPLDTLTNKPTFNFTLDAPLKNNAPAQSTNDGGSRRPCPQCSSPARILNTNMSQCDKCCYEFCPKCFKPSHGHNDCSILSSPPRKRADVVACNRKAKKRLRRL